MSTAIINLSKNANFSRFFSKVDDCLAQKMDIAIVGDISKSMKKDHRDKLINLVKSLVDKKGISAEGNHIAIVTFGSQASIKTDFKDNKYYSTKSVKDKINKEFRQNPGKAGTRTDLVLNLALKNLFIPAAGDRPDAQNLMLIFTDGRPWIGKWDDRKMIPFEDSTEALEVLSLKPYFTFIRFIG